MYKFIRSLLFLLSPETAHRISLAGLSRFSGRSADLSPTPSEDAPINVMGISFQNRLGIAAGLDKNGAHICALAALGFGFIEVGTVTPRPQSGNPKPRLFRIPKAAALINRMGFNNVGVAALIANVQRANFQGILGINIGKNADTPLEKAVDDYVFCLEKVYPHASYIAVNISSPNTPGLRELQNVAYLDHLLSQLKKTQMECAKKHQRYAPLVVKISPDLDAQQLKQLAETLLAHRVDGVIATNTTLARDPIRQFKQAKETGGLSGKPLFELSLNTVTQLGHHLAGGIPIIACGGISNKAEMAQMISAGASLVQIYTSFIYQGPGIVKRFL
jgi:dihydroorotate dehydrogenase